MKLSNLTVLHGILRDPLIAAFAAADGKKSRAQFLRRLYERGAETAFAAYVADAVLTDENAFSRACAARGRVSSFVREAYLAGDREAAKQLCKKIDLVIRKVKKFYELYSAQWYTDNKPNGMEVQDARLGGLIARLSACRKRLSDWADGKGDLPELKEERIYAAPETNGEHDGLLYNCWTATISACPV